MRQAISDIVNITYIGFINNDANAVLEVDPLEEIVDRLRDTIKTNHVNRLRKSECTIEHGFVLSDLLTNFERVSDHCSNIAGCVFEISSFDALDLHKYSQQHKSGDAAFDAKVEEFATKYSLELADEQA
jgi:phosphate:Na+ symporter